MVDEVTRAADIALAAVRTMASETHQFDIALFVRGVNALKAVRLLTADGHWEIATAPARQLYELVLAAEELNRASDRNEAALRFANFGLLQAARAALARIEYDAATGRPVDDDHRQRLVGFLASGAVGEFRTVKGNGKIAWAQSWSGKTARALAEASDQPLRLNQYELLFTAWSEETHAAPGALIDSITRRVGDQGIKGLIADDDRNVAEVQAMSLMLFFELGLLLPDAPDLGAKAIEGWINRLRSWTFERFGIDEEPAPAQSAPGG
ncbi:DUF5677 domain-containing protein [Actinotalea sp. C106]|uniref:DUF5677 domain-containing protein n=1 Tax=Actinotalea sp. C106 TaxID=2908644 RepID=UPI002029557A|nr:DUF5677 domain-containing protein [Actinotalea sp. C106]